MVFARQCGDTDFSVNPWRSSGSEKLGEEWLFSSIKISGQIFESQPKPKGSPISRRRRLPHNGDCIIYTRFNNHPMDFSLISAVNKLDPIGITILILFGLLLFYFALAKFTYISMLILCLSASFVGSTISIVDNLSSLLRWLAIFLLLISGILRSQIKVSAGVLFFWGYVFLGLIFLFRANIIEWQFQKGVLLLIVALAIPLAYCNESYRLTKYSLISVSLAGVIFSLFNFISLPGELSEAVRFSGYSKGAASFALFLGGLLPFTFWGLWRTNNRAIRVACVSGFIFGFITLMLTGQRTGTIAALIALIPLLISIKERKIIVWCTSLIILGIFIGYILVGQSSAGRVSFLFDRYSFDSDLSGRTSIWEKAFSLIAENPFLGRGIGASETVMSDSFHNAYLEIWFNTGLPGLFLFLAAQFFFLYRIIYLGRKFKDPESKAILALALGYMSGFIFMCFFESIGAAASSLNVILYLFLGVLVSNNYPADYTQPPRNGNRVRMLPSRGAQI